MGLHTMEYHCAMKKDKLGSIVGNRMYLETMLSETHQTCKLNYYIVLLYEKLKAFRAN